MDGTNTADAALAALLGDVINIVLGTVFLTVGATACAIAAICWHRAVRILLWWGIFSGMFGLQKLGQTPTVLTVLPHSLQSVAPYTNTAVMYLLLISLLFAWRELTLGKLRLLVKMEQRGRILGIGGVFFKSANRDQMREWYSKHLGLADKGQGAMLPWREHDDPQKEHVTVWTVFPASTKYFDPSPAPFMINYIVDDMDALLDRLKQEGVKIDAKRMDESYGRFAWIYDMDGNKIELWQPLPAKP